jgi:tetratricopeptide (TPR) repeat protein
MIDRRLLSSAALALALIATPLVASGQPARAKYGSGRNADIKVNVKLSDRVKPSAPKTDLPAAAPDVTADQVLNIEAAVGDIRKEQVQLLDDMIEDCAETKCDVDEAADLYFRKAELHAQQQRFYRLKTQEFAIKSDTAKKKADKDSFKKQSEDMGKKAQKALIDAVKVYKALADNDNFRNFSQMPKALFFYGYTLQSGKYMKEAREVYDKLLKNYPQSPYVPEAHLAFADYHFENNQLADAESRYKRVLQFPKSSVYWYAMYKMGWVHLNLGRHQDALEVFYNVAMATKNDKKKEILNRAAKKDIVRAYAEVGNVQKAYNYFQKVDKSFAFDMYQLLGDFFIEQGKSEKGIYVFRDLVSLAQKNKNVCLWQYNVAHLMLTAGSNQNKVEEIEKLVKLYGVLRENKTLPAAEAEECHDNAAAMAGELARAWHSESAKTKNPETLAYAEKLYKVYLEVFKDAEDYAETQYYYSELIWSRAESEKNQRLATELWENAALAFTDVVKTGKVDQKLMKESAYAAVLAWKNALNVDPRVKSPPPVDEKQAGKIPKPQDIPEREQKMMAAFDVYINYIKDPKDEDLVGMKFLKANIYRRYNHFDEAIPIFQEILTKHRQHETALYSANILLDNYIIHEDYDKLLALANELAADKKFLEGKEELVERLGDIQAKSLRKAAEKLEKDAKATKDIAKYIECGKSYSEIYNKNTEAAGSDEVLYNAAVCFEEGKSVGLALSMYKKLEEMGDQARKDIRAKAVARMGVAYSRIAYYGEAAKYLELFYAKYAGVKGREDIKDAKDALSDAVFYRKGIGDDDQAIKDTTNFVANRDAKKSEKAEAYFSLYAIYEKQGKTDELIKHLRSYIGKYKSDGGPEKLVMAHAKIGLVLWQQSCPKSIKLVDGSCIKVERQRAIVIKSKKGKRKRTIQTQCGPESKVKVIVVQRDKTLVKQAMAAFNNALKAFDGVKAGSDKDNGGAGLAQYWAAMAKFYLTEPAYEEYLGIAFPANLNFDPKDEGLKKKSMKRFDEWYAKKDNNSKSLAERYTAVQKIGDASFAIAAAARIGQVAQNASDALFTAEIPENIRKYEEAAEIYCDTLMDKAEPLENFTIQYFTACIEKSTEYGYFSEWSHLCERELGQIQPDKFPTASELRSDPTENNIITDVEPPTIKLEQ